MSAAISLLRTQERWCVSRPSSTYPKVVWLLYRTDEDGDFSRPPFLGKRDLDKTSMAKQFLQLVPVRSLKARRVPVKAKPVNSDLIRH
jgi:hypothetical protein